MTYKEYTARTRKLKADQAALDKRFIEEYRYRGLFGKVVMVRFRFRGKILTEKAYFERIEGFFHDIVPVFKQIDKNGKPKKYNVASIYSLKQIEEITPIDKEVTNGQIHQPSKGNESRTTGV